MAAAAAFAHHILVHSQPSSSSSSSDFFILSKTITKNGFNIVLPFIHRRRKSSQTLASATDSLLQLGGLQISKQDVVKDEPTNNVPDLIFTKLGLQLQRRDNHPLGILKNAIYEYFDTNYNNQFQKFDDLCPIVTTKMNFDDALVPADHVIRSYNDTYYVDADTVLRDSIDSTHYPVFHQMEGVKSSTQVIGMLLAWMALYMLHRN
nr:phenylalanine--tRNA ligase, chloroplastic/mitochondrial [Tanacetum cinerariifolium]